MRPIATVIFIAAVMTIAPSCKKKGEKGTTEQGPSAGSVPQPPPAPDAAAAMTPPAPPPYAPAADVPEAIKAAVTAADRSDDDKALDAGRKPGEVFAFFKLAPGQKVFELYAGGGYSTEIMARIVGDKGKVFAQNGAKKPLEERLAKPVMKNVVVLEQAPDAPLPKEAKDLDAVICILNYHDFTYMKVDRAKLNKMVFDALKKGGVYGIVDHSATAGSGAKDAETLHRVDEELVKKEILAAGFKLDASSDVLRNPDDKRDWNSSPASGARRGTSDRFTLRFVKP